MWLIAQRSGLCGVSPWQLFPFLSSRARPDAALVGKLTVQEVDLCLHQVHPEACPKTQNLIAQSLSCHLLPWPPAPWVVNPLPSQGAEGMETPKATTPTQLCFSQVRGAPLPSLPSGKGPGHMHLQEVASFCAWYGHMKSLVPLLLTLYIL